MLFNSFPFILFFLPVTCLGFFALGHFGWIRLAGLWLTLASLFFYGWWNPVYLVLIVASILFNYWTGFGINHAIHADQPRPAKYLLTFGVCANLALLGYFKYANFFVDSCRTFFGVHWELAHIALPLAISFFTFTQIAYLVDAYHGLTKTYDFLYYALFVSFFPHLIAGPIVSYRSLMPQFADPRNYRFDAENFARGLTLFVLGLAKKVLLADKLAPLAQDVFDQNLFYHAQTLPTWTATFAYTFQLYFDFSGYSDMAIGLGFMFNVRFPLNFRSPYKSWDISEFWQRWHMTLSRFLRDHLYIPLGGNRHGEPRRYFNLMVTMLLGGLWHGAGWTFVLWGALHGFYLVVHHAWQRLTHQLAWANTRLAAWVGRGLTFVAVVVGWVFFRSRDVKQACDLLATMAGFGSQSHQPSHVTSLVLASVQQNLEKIPPVSDHPLGLSNLLLLLVSGLIVFTAPNADEIFRIAIPPEREKPQEVRPPLFQINLPWAIVTIAVLTLALLEATQVSEFLYFRF